MNVMGISNQTIDWLLEPSDPGARYLALRDVIGLPANDADLAKARQIAHREGPIARVLQNMNPEGWWEKPGPGYGPKYRSTVWAVILLSQLGASVHEDTRVQTAATYMLEHALTQYGQFTYSGAPGGTFGCLQGNLCNALLKMGVQDERLERAFDWMARSVTGEGVAPLTEKKEPQRYNAYLCGPGFLCGANYKQACAWGAVKIMLAFGNLPAAGRTEAVNSAIRQGLDFLLSVDPATAAYPTPADQKPNQSWWKFGFPVFYITDVLQLAESILACLPGYEPRLDPLLDLIRSKQDESGCWKMEYDYTGKTWGNYGSKGQPNKWVTLRAMRVLDLAEKLQSAVHMH